MQPDFSGATWAQDSGPTAAALMVEHERRLPTWTPGPAIPLPAGVTLHLPTLDPATVTPTSELSCEVDRLLAAHAVWSRAIVETEGDPERNRKLVGPWSAWLGVGAALAFRLLEQQYGFTEAEAIELAKPAEAFAPFALGDALRTAFDPARIAWMGVAPEVPPTPEQLPALDFEGGGWDGSDSATPLVEHRRRRDGWSAGAVMPLAVGHGWRLPVLDLTVMATTPGLEDAARAMMAGASAAAERMAGTSIEDDPVGWIRANQPWLNLKTDLVIRLLRVNYSLDDDEIRLLMDWPTPAGFLNFVAATTPLNAAFPLWTPLLLPTVPAAVRDASFN